MKMALFALTIAALVAASLLAWQSPERFFSRNKQKPVAELPTADSYMKKTTTTQFDEHGNKAYQLLADSGLYYSKTDQFELQKPRLTIRTSTSNGASTPPWQMSAQWASSAQRGNEIILNGNVHAWQQLNTRRKTEKTEFFTKDLHFFPNTNKAKTLAAVKLLHPSSVTTGTGMEANFTAQTYKLLANVEGYYHAR